MIELKNQNDKLLDIFLLGNCIIHMLLCEDLFQLPLVRSNYTFEPSSLSQNSKKKQYELSGFEVWHIKKRLIILDNKD